MQKNPGHEIPKKPSLRSRFGCLLFKTITQEKEVAILHKTSTMGSVIIYDYYSFY